MTSVLRAGAPGNGAVTSTTRGIGSSGSSTPAVAASRPAHGPAASIDGLRVDGAVGRLDSGQPVRRGHDRRRLDAGPQVGPGAARDGGVAKGQPRRIGDPVRRAVHRTGHPVHVQPRDELGGALRPQETDVDAEAPLHLGGRPESGPGRVAPDEEQVAVLDHVQRQPVGRFEPDDQRDARERQLDVHPARELVAEATRAATGGARAEGELAFEEDDPSRTGGGQMVGGADPDHSAADDHHVGSPRQACGDSAGGASSPIVRPAPAAVGRELAARRDPSPVHWCLAGSSAEDA